MGGLRDWILGNWWLKLLALGLAYALWSIVIQAPLVEVGVSVPLELRHLPAELEMAGEIPARVHLHLRGPQRILRGLQPEEIGVTVDLSRAAPGIHSFGLRSENVEVPPGVEVVRITPEAVQVELVLRSVPRTER